LRGARAWPRGLVSPRRMMVLRNFFGRPLRSTLSVVGVALAVPMVVLGLFWRDALDRMIDVQFTRIERGNVTVTFVQPRDSRVVRDLTYEPGVLVAEGLRTVPVRLRAGPRAALTALIGLPADATLRQPRDVALRPIEVAAHGLTLSRRLAERLGIVPGSLVSVEVMEGRRSSLSLPLGALVDEAIGMAAYIDLEALDRLTGEGDVVSAATLVIDPSAIGAFSERLKQLPAVAAVSIKALTLASFLDKIAGLVLVTAAILTAFAVVIAVGVVYNGASVSLQERARELASLRVLGYTRAEVAGLLFGQFVLELVLGVPLGLLLSRLMVEAMVRSYTNESFQIPAVIEPRTYVAAALVVLAAAAASAYAVRRRIDALDLVTVLKTRE
jgi:putative ABC transport system permease protein